MKLLHSNEVASFNSDGLQECSSTLSSASSGLEK